MADARDRLVGWLDKERDQHIGFLQGFVREKTPNPPGDTRHAVRFITKFLEAQGCEVRIISPHPEYPNVVATFECGAPGRHLVLNGHIDVFPVADDGAGWSQDPWGGDIVGNKMYGRGIIDMKVGTTASIMTFALLSRLKSELKGRLTLTAVSDEETFGPWGARYLMEHHPEVHGDCLLNGEPSGPMSIRFGERGPYWLEFTVRTPGAHGAYTHASKSATKIAFALAQELETLTTLSFRASDNVMKAIDAGRAMMDKMMGPGAGDLVDKVTLNIGTIQGGAKNNMVPSSCTFTADFRLPVGATKQDLLPHIQKIVAKYPDVEMREIGGTEPSYCDPNSEMIEILQQNVVAAGRPKPVPIISLGGTDARLWRLKGIPGIVYGPYPHGMGTVDEHVEIEEFLHIVRTHALSAFDYLSKG